MANTNLEIKSPIEQIIKAFLEANAVYNKAKKTTTRIMFYRDLFEKYSCMTVDEMKKYRDKGSCYALHLSDPVAGSGTTLRAAAELGRNAYGFEIKKDFFKAAREKMLDVVQPDILTVIAENEEAERKAAFIKPAV